MNNGGTFDFINEYELWVNIGVGTDRHACRQTDRQTDGHISNMTQPGLGAWLSENFIIGRT